MKALIIRLYLRVIHLCTVTSAALVNKIKLKQKRIKDNNILQYLQITPMPPAVEL